MEREGFEGREFHDDKLMNGKGEKGKPKQIQGTKAKRHGITNMYDGFHSVSLSLSFTFFSS